MRTTTRKAPSDPGPRLDDATLTAIRDARERVDAIKIYRRETDAGHKDAAERVDAIRAAGAVTLAARVERVLAARAVTDPRVLEAVSDAMPLSDLEDDTARAVLQALASEGCPDAAAVDICRVCNIEIAAPTEPLIAAVVQAAAARIALIAACKE